MARVNRKKAAKKPAKKTAKKVARKSAKKAARKTARSTPAHVTHINALAAANPAFKALVAKYGVPKPMAGSTALKPVVTESANAICMETDCVDGKKIVMRRNSAGDCTEFSEVPC
jgi:hypothetical protein